jgi:hypothetical protein
MKCGSVWRRGMGEAREACLPVFLFYSIMIAEYVMIRWTNKNGRIENHAKS